MSQVRDYVRQQLSSKLDRHSVVVWADPHHEYGDIVNHLIPDDATFHRFDGSWYELRRRGEPSLAQLQPRLIVYVDREGPEEDPLTELRAAGTEFRLRLATLLQKTMSSEIAATKLLEICNAASTLGEAEALLESGAAAGPAHLVKILRLHEPTELILELARIGPAIMKEHPELLPEATIFLETHLGTKPSAADDIDGAIVRHLVLIELSSAIDALPLALERATPAISAEQRRRCEAVLTRWRNDQGHRATFDAAMRVADEDLALGVELRWVDALTALDTVPSYDDIAFAEYLRRLDADQYADAEQLANSRLRSRWVLGAETEERAQRWHVAHAVAHLRRQIEQWSAASTHSLADHLRRYANDDWRIDRAHRRLELALLGLTDRRSLEEPIRAARHAYDTWLDNYLRRVSATAETEGLATGDLLLQGHIHAEVVAPRAKHGPVAYFMVDALRYELGHDLLDALHRQFDGGEINIQPAVGLLPSITTVGMANLCPGAERGLELELDASDRLVVRLEGQEVKTPPHRVNRLQATHGQMADLRLDDIVRFSENELAEKVDGANLVLVRSQEIDEQGETGKLNIGLNGFDATVRDLSRAVARLAHHNITQFVIGADHGFIALTRQVGDHMIISKPGGRGEVHRRAFIGRGGATNDAPLRLPLNRMGLPGDLDVVVPRGLALIAAGGSRGFFHGGLSPQEIIVPVLTVHVSPISGGTVLTVDAHIAPRITGHIFTGKVILPHNLLSEPLTVRPVPERTVDGQEVGTLATAGGSEQGEGLVRLTPGEEVTLGFRVTTNLAKNQKIALHVYDARTDRQLGVSKKPATVARKLEVEDELP